VRAIIAYLRQRLSQWRADLTGVEKVNLCCGTQSIPGYLGVDFGGPVDLKLDLRVDNLPFADNSLQVLVCISAINYFTRHRGQEIIREVHRVLRPGGVVRFGVQDMEWIARRYVERDIAFFFQKLPDGQDRFEGPTLGDKFAAWFYGYLWVPNGRHAVSLFLRLRITCASIQGLWIFAGREKTIPREPDCRGR